LLIPQLQMNSNARYCDAIQVSYEIQVEAEISGSHKNIFVVIPVVIGSKSLNFKQPLCEIPNSASATNYSKASAPNDRKLNNLVKLKKQTMILKSFLAPPSFEEAIRMNFEQPIIILDGVLKISYLGDKTISVIC
jgi:hypothetical protein